MFQLQCGCLGTSEKAGTWFANIEDLGAMELPPSLTSSPKKDHNKNHLKQYVSRFLVL